MKTPRTNQSSSALLKGCRSARVVRLQILLAAVVLMILSISVYVVVAADQTWSGGGTGNNTAWYSLGNWVGGAFPGSGPVTTNTDIATIPSTGTNPTIGISGATNPTLYLGAINFTGANRAIGDSSATSFTFQLNGTTVNSVSNVILRNSGAGTLTLQNNGGGAGTMTVALGNATNNIVNIDSTGGITISSIISGSSRHLTRGGAGIGILTLSGVNTYSGNTFVSSGTIALSGSGSIANSPSIEVAGGAVFDVSGLTTALTLSSGQALKASGTTSSGTIATASGKGLTTASNSPLQFTSFNGTTPPLTITGAGTVTVAGGNVATVTVSNGGTPLGVGNYTLISKGASGGVVGSAPSSVTVGGDGIAAGTNASLQIIGQQLVLVIATCPTFFTVDSNGDASDAAAGDGVCATTGSVCTLRAAIQESNALTFCGSTITIDFDGSLSGGTINLTPNGEIPITRSVTVNGLEASLLTINGGTGNNRLFLTSNGTVTITDLTLTGGNGNSPGQGGAIYVSSGTLILNRVHVTGNSVVDFGGGVHFGGGTNHVIDRSTFSGNSASDCGAIRNQSGGLLTITNSTISGNSAGSSVAGGLCTLSGASTTLRNVTVANNTSAFAGGGIVHANGGTTDLGNTIVAGNTDTFGRPEIYIPSGSVISSGNNLVGDSAGDAAATGTAITYQGNDILDTPPKLAPLNNYTGPTQTRALLCDSPAINTGNNTGAPATDQRGVGRPVGGTVDIGAYEANITLTVNPSSLPSGATGVPYSQTLTPTGGTSPYTFFLGSGTLPTGLTISSGGTLSGTPSATGTFIFTVLATDVNGEQGCRSYTVSINPTMYRSAATGNWNANATWQVSDDGTSWFAAPTTPTSTNALAITIRTGHNVTVSANVNADQLTVDSGGTLTINNGVTLTIDDGTGTDLIVNGTANVTNTGVIGGAGSFTLSSGASLGIGADVGITSSGASGSIQVTGTRLFSTGANYSYNRTTGGQSTGNGLPATVNHLTVTTVGVCSLGSSVVVNGNFAIAAATLNGTEFNSNSNSVTVNGNYDNTQGIYSATFPGVIIFGGNPTTIGSGSGNNNFASVTISSGASISGAGLIRCSGDWADNSTSGGASGNNFSGTVQFGPGGAVTRTVGGSVAAPKFSRVEVQAVSGAIVQAAKGLDIDGIFVLGSGTFDDGGFSHTIHRHWWKTAGTTYTATGTITFDGNFSSEIEASNFNNLAVNKDTSTQTATLTTGAVTVAGSFTLTKGVFAVSGRTLTLNGPVSQTSDASLTSAAAGTVNYSKSSDVQNVLAADYGTLTFSNFNKTLASSGTIGITTNFSPGTATGHTVTGSTIEYHIAGLTGSSTTILPPAFTHYNNLHINQPGNTVGPTGLVVDTTLRLLQGTFTSASDYHHVVIDSGTTLSLTADITVSGNWTNNGTFNSNGFTVTFDGTANQTIGGSSLSAFATLAISNTGSSSNNIVSLAQNISDTALEVTNGEFNQGASSNLTSGGVTVSSGATWKNLGTGDVTLSGAVSNSGTINLNANGATCGDTDDILIRSSSAGVQRAWSGGGTFTLIDVDVRDQTGTALITVRNATDSGNNGLNWTFISSCAGVGQTYTWQPVGGSTDWQVAANWNPDRLLPNVEDIIVFDFNETPAPTVTNLPTQTIAAMRLINGTSVQMSTGAANTLTISGGSSTALSVPALNSLTIEGTSALRISLTSGSQGTSSGVMVLEEGPHQLLATGGAIVTFNSGAIFTTASTYSSSTNPFGTGIGGNGSNNSIIFASGSDYFHNAGLSPFGTAGSGPVTIFQTGSEARWLTSSGFQASGRTYADLVIGDSSTTTSVSDSGTGSFQFDNLIINKTDGGSSLSYDGSAGTATITIQGSITSNGTTAATLPDVTLTSGSGGILISKPGNGTITFGNDGNNARGIRFESNTTVVTGTTLSLSRKLQLGLSQPNNLVLRADGGISGSDTGYVIGTVRKTSIPSGSFTFPVGKVTGFTPVALTNATSSSADLTVKPVPSNHPSTTDSLSLDEYWTLTLNSGTLTTDLTFTYLQADVDGTESNYRVIKINGATIVNFPATALNTANNTATVTGISGFSDWTLGEPVGPTAVKLERFDATSFSDGVRLSWETGFEVNNLGYHVYRELNGKRTRVTPSVIAGSALTVGPGSRLTAGYSYSWFDPEGTHQAVYSLEAIDLDGSSEWAGPIYSSAGPIRGKTPRSPARRRATLLNEIGADTDQDDSGLSSWPASMKNAGGSTKAGLANDMTVASSDALAIQQTIAAGKAVKIHVSRSGWHRVTQAELVAAGFDATSDARMLQLYVDGEQVPISLSTDGARLGANDTLEFYGVALDTPTTDTQVYWLISGSSAGKRVIARRSKLKPANQLSEPVPGSFDLTVERKNRLSYFSSLLNGDAENIFGAPVRVNPINQTLPIKNFDLESVSQPYLEVALQGLTVGGHRVQVQVNGTSIGTITFADRQHQVATFPVNPGLLHEGDNVVSLASLNGPSDISLADRLRLTYPHQYRADNDMLQFSVLGGEAVRINGFTNPNIRVIDVTNPNSPTPLLAIANHSGDSYSVRVQSQGSGTRTMLAVSDDLMAHPAATTANQPSDWNAEINGADMVIITHKDFRQAVEPLAILRRNQGLSVAVVDVEDVYDEFTYGAHTPFAIKSFLMAAANWNRKPAYLLLVGDSSWDPRGYLNGSEKDFVPTKLIDTQAMETGSDDWFADFTDAGMANMAIGRLPAGSAAEANLMVSKIIAYEQERELNPPRGAVMVADRGFEAQSSQTFALLPFNITVQAINRGEVASDDIMRGQIVDALNQGPMIVNYYGHGSVSVWTGNGLLNSDLAANLTNNNRLSLFVMMTCLNGYASDANIDSLAEATLKAPNGGAVAVWASSGFTTPPPQLEMNKEFYRLLFGAQPIRLGEAIRRAKAATSDMDVRRTWVLLGDPAMRIR